MLEDISLTIPQGARIAVKTNNEIAALAFADLLTREVIPHRGSVEIAGHDLNALHQVTLANCIGYAHSNPHILRGTLGENLMIPFKVEPILGPDVPPEIDRFRTEAMRAGNSTDPFDIDWIDPKVAGLQSSEEIREWWFQLVEAMYFGNYEKVVYLAQTEDPDLDRRAQEAARKLGLAYERRQTGYGELSDFLLRTG